jgi:hypothetical protein
MGSIEREGHSQSICQPELCGERSPSSGKHISSIATRSGQRDKSRRMVMKCENRRRCGVGGVGHIFSALLDIGD